MLNNYKIYLILIILLGVLPISNAIEKVTIPQIKFLDFQATHSIPSFEVLQKGMAKTQQELDEAFKKVKTDKEKIELINLISTRLSMQEDTLDLAVDLLDKSYKDFKKTNLNQALEFLALKGVVQLRRGEVLNCNLRHNSHSCIFPLSKEAVHVDKKQVQNAINSFEEYLKYKPADMHIKWLLNIAHQANGSYPSKVSLKYLINIQDEININFPRLRNYAKEIGLLSGRGAGGVAVEDFRNVHCSDLVISDVIGGVTYLKNNCNGTFSNYSKESGLSEIEGAINLSMVDFDNDGLIDLYFHRGSFIPMYLPALQKNLLFKNLGGGRFKDITDNVGFAKSWTTSNAVAWLDINNDGWMDLFVCNQQKESDLFINNHGHFSQIIQKSKISKDSYCTTVSTADVNNDGYADLYVSRWGKGGEVYLNQQDLTFKMSKVPGSPLRSLNSVFFDLDNDGYEDLFVTSNSGNPGSYIDYSLGNKFNQTESIKLFKNDHKNNFLDISNITKLNAPLSVMGGNVGDFDNDGYVDLFLGTGNPSFSGLLPNKFYKNSEGKKFHDVSIQAGVSNLQKGHGVTFADINRDGQLDLFASVGGMFESDKFFPDLFINPGFKNKWLEIRLHGKESNRFGIGARVRVKVKDAKGKLKNFYTRIGQSASFGSSPLIAHLGLGSATQIVELELQWPNIKRSKEVFTNIPLDSFIEIKEGDGRFAVIRSQKFLKFKDSSNSTHGAHYH